MTFWPKVSIFGLHLAKLTKCSNLSEIWHVARVITQGLAHHVSAYYSFPRLKSVSACRHIKIRTLIAANTTTTDGF